MSPAQCRAARGLLKWTQDDLAANAQVTVVTIRNFESDEPSSPHASLDVMRRALEKAGVEFTNGATPGVKLLIRESD
jgi:transcriptional regulator with XRE-family HTH domain